MDLHNYYWRLHYKCQRLQTLLYDLFLWFYPHKILINAWINRVGTTFLRRNWGDDINILFFEEVMKNKIVVKNNSVLFKNTKKTSISCIGSIIGMETNSYSEIWGSGVISQDTIIKQTPQKIHSVRGPLTREVLLRQGIPCPQIYGDPALLVSRYYKTSSNINYKLGIITHYVDEDNLIIKNFCESHPNVLFISMTKYNHWHDIPEKIVSCEKIISSSLHGLIVSDSYGIPNIWVEFSKSVNGNGFKFRDYFASVGRIDKDAISVCSQDDLERLLDQKEYPTASFIDYQSIYESCPFKDQLPAFK